MLTVRELKKVASGMDLQAFVLQIGPFALVQKPTPERLALLALQMGAGQTVIPFKENAGEVTTALALGDLLVATLPNDIENGITIGRLPDCELVVDDPTVSKHHARILWSDGAGVATLEDLGSSNGTFVNAEPLREVRALQDEDRISFGDAEFWFFWSDSLYRRMQRES